MNPRWYNRGVQDRNESPLILAFVSELMSQTRIETTAQSLGYQIIWIERMEQIAPPDLNAPRRQLAEHLVGPGAALIEKLTVWKPALILCDLGNEQIPWREWVALIKSVPATRRYPLICFGSHVAADKIKIAQEAGADAVLARSSFFSDLANIIQKFARPIDYQALVETCQLPLSHLALEGLELFNRGDYFEAHELLEEAWNEDETPGRELYRAILQVAVAYLQVERGNYSGVLKMFLRVRQWIDPLPDQCRGVDVARLRQDAEAVRQQVLALGRERIVEFDPGLFRPVIYSYDS
jgi:hypothetical protein